MSYGRCHLDQILDPLDLSRGHEGVDDVEGVVDGDAGGRGQQARDDEVNRVPQEVKAAKDRYQDEEE